MSGTWMNSLIGHRVVGSLLVVLVGKTAKWSLFRFVRYPADPAWKLYEIDVTCYPCPKLALPSVTEKTNNKITS